MSSNYEFFISETIQNIKQKRLENSLLPVIKQYPVANSEVFGQRLANVLINSVENLDKLLIEIYSKWDNNNGKLLWFTGYDDLLRTLRTIFWNNNATTYFVHNPDSYLWTEIGLRSFFKKEKLKENVDNPDIQFFVVDKIFASDNRLLISGDKSLPDRINNGKTNVFLAGIEQVFSNIEDLELYLKIANDNKLNFSDNSIPFIYTPSAKNNDHLFIMDNMRSNVMQFTKQRKALACLHCGRCNEVCPVFQCTGDKAYDNIFSGPIANILLPHLETIDDYKFVSYACTMCGNCEKVCPVSLSLRDMIMENRKFFLEKGHLSFGEKQRVKKLHKTLQNRKKLNKVAILKSMKMRKMTTKDLRRSRKLTKFEKQSFNQQYIKKLKETN